MLASAAFAADAASPFTSNGPHASSKVIAQTGEKVTLIEGQPLTDRKFEDSSLKNGHSGLHTRVLRSGTAATHVALFHVGSRDSSDISWNKTSDALTSVVAASAASDGGWDARSANGDVAGLLYAEHEDGSGALSRIMATVKHESTRALAQRVKQAVNRVALDLDNRGQLGMGVCK
jgi:hypothetical protein